MRPTTFLVSCVLALSSCSDAGGVDDDASTASTSNEPSGDIPPIGDVTIVDDTSTGDDTSTDDGSDSFGSSGSGGDTGETAPPGLELLVTAEDAGGSIKVFYAHKAVDGGLTGPVQVVPPGAASWIVVDLFADRRVVYEVQARDGDDVMLGVVDSDADMVQLDVAPVGEGDLGDVGAIPHADAVAFVDETTDTLFRVDFADGRPETPLSVAHGVVAGHDPPLVDPSGRWVAVDLLPASPGLSNDVALSRIDVPDPDSTVALTELGPDQHVGHSSFSNDGDSFFYVLVDEPTATVELRHVDLRGELIGATTLVGDPLGPDRSIHNLFPAAEGGLAYSVVDTSGTQQSALWFTSVADGAVAPAVEVLGPAAGTYWWVWYSPDDRWLSFRAEVDGVERSWLLDAGADGPTLHELPATSPSGAVFTADSQSLLLVHDEGAGPIVSRASLGDDGPGPLELVGQSAGDVVMDWPRGVGYEGSAVLLDGTLAGEPVQLVLDLSGRLPTAPVVLSAPTRGGWAQAGEVCTDDRHAGYFERMDAFGPERLILVDLHEPGDTVAIMDNVLVWRSVPQVMR